MNDLMNSVISDAEREAYKRQFELENPNGPRMSVNVGGYGNLLFKDDSAFQQFQQNPQSMTFSQGPGGQRYVEPRDFAAEARFQNLDENFNFRPNPNNMTNNYVGGIPSLLQQNNSGLLPYIGSR